MDLSNDNDKRLKELNDKKIIEFTPAIVYVVIVMVFGIFGNFFSIAFYGFRAAKTSTSLLITAVAAIDLVTCFGFCAEIIELCYTLTFRNAIGCRLMYFFNHWMVYTSGCILVLLGVDRYRTICKRKYWQVTNLSAKCGIATVVILCAVLSLKDFFIFDIHLVNLTVVDSNESVIGYYCVQCKEESMALVAYGANYIDVLLFLVIVISTIILYSFVARKVWKHRIRMHRPIIKSRTSETPTEGPEISTISSSTAAETNETVSGMAVETSLTIPGTVADTNRNISGKMTETNEVETVVLNENYEAKCNKVNEYSNSKRVSLKLHRKSESERSSADTLEKTDENGRNQIDTFSTGNYTKKKRARKLERRIAVMMIVTTAASFVSFVPHFVLNLVVRMTSDLQDNHDFDVVLQIVWRSFLLNSAVNPYVMGFFNTDFRRFCKNLVSKCRP